MKTQLIFTVATLLLPLAASNAGEPPGASDLKTEISEWRTSVLPSLQPEDYWADLKALGAKVEEAHAKRIVESQATGIDSAIALMAYHSSSQRGKVDEIAGWYGRHLDEVDREHWLAMRERLSASGLSDRAVHSELAHGWSPQMRANAPVMKLIATAHASHDYLHAWEAWMLSPPSLERHRMRQRMNEALAAVGDERTIALLVEKCRILPEHRFRQEHPERRQEEIRSEAGEIRSIIRAIGGKAAVLGLLECAKIAEEMDYGGDEPDSVRDSIARNLSSSYNPRQLREMPEWAETLRDPENPTQLVPWDDQWKEFKPIIEELLEAPGDLRPEDIRTLEAALAAMPE